MNGIAFLLACSLIAAALPAVATPSAAASAATLAPTSEASAGIVRRVSFVQLGSPSVLALSTTDDTIINFGSRGDELLTKAVLHLRYIYSPALIGTESHLKISLNEVVVGVIVLPKENAGRNLTADIDIDPRLIVDFNRLAVTFVGHYAADCEDPARSSLWANVSGASELEFASLPMALASDLAMLPEPFLDRGDSRRLMLPFVFAEQPSKSTLQAAAIVASWFGKQAAWRGARFPTHVRELPPGHAIVFATNAERPAFLAGQPAFVQPGLKIIANPSDGHSKLLLVFGRDGRDLKMAADALTLGTASLSGPSATVKEVKELGQRSAYDAPAWVRLDRPTKFGELIDFQQQLQAAGHVPAPIRINLRIPPDLFLWRNRGVPMDVRYRYTPPAIVDQSRLDIGINDELLKVTGLRASAQSEAAPQFLLPLQGDGLSADRTGLSIPAYKLAGRSQLQFRFQFMPKKVGNCRDVQTAAPGNGQGSAQADSMRAAIDADSTIDFSGYLHYAELPNLGYFASLGYPFTKYADLSQTVIVLPQQPSPQDIETMLALVGRMGESTGIPATKVTIAGPEDEALFQDADLLVIGIAPQQTMLERWGDRMPASISGSMRRISQPLRNDNFLYDWLGHAVGKDAAAVSEQQIEGMAPMAALLAFESPYTDRRSVVAVTAVSPEDLSRVLDVLEDPKTVGTIRGSVALIHPRKVASLLVGPTYFTGTLPWWMLAWFNVSQYPLVLSTLILGAALLLGFVLWHRWRGRIRSHVHQRHPGDGHA